MDEILQKYNLKYDDLTPVERETLNSWISNLEQGQLSTEKLKDYIHTMKEAVETELTKVGHESKQDIFLKARLRNYMLLEAFLLTPEKAKARMEQALASMAGRPL